MYANIDSRICIPLFLEQQNHAAELINYTRFQHKTYTPIHPHIYDVKGHLVGG